MRKNLFVFLIAAFPGFGQSPDTTGEKTWEIDLKPTISTAVKIDSGNYLISGTCYQDYEWKSSKAFSCVIDSNGKIIGTPFLYAYKYIDTLLNTTARKAIKDSDGNYLMCGFTEYDQNYNAGGFVVRYDKSKNILWQFRYKRRSDVYLPCQFRELRESSANEYEYVVDVYNSDSKTYKTFIQRISKAGIQGDADTLDRLSIHGDVRYLQAGYYLFADIINDSLRTRLIDSDAEVKSEQMIAIAASDIIPNSIEEIDILSPDSGVIIVNCTQNSKKYPVSVFFDSKGAYAGQHLFEPLESITSIAKVNDSAFAVNGVKQGNTLEALLYIATPDNDYTSQNLSYATFPAIFPLNNNRFLMIGTDYNQKEKPLQCMFMEINPPPYFITTEGLDTTIHEGDAYADTIYFGDDFTGDSFILSSVAGKPSSMRIAIVDKMVIISWTPQQGSDAGVYTITLKVRDRKMQYTDPLGFTITVEPVSQPVKIDSVTYTPRFPVDGEMVTFIPYLQCDDSNAVSYKWFTNTIEAGTDSKLSFNAVYNEGNSTSVKLLVNDGEYSDSIVLSVPVTQKTIYDTLSIQSISIPDKSFFVGDSIKVVPAILDEDYSKVSYIWRINNDIVGNDSILAIVIPETNSSKFTLSLSVNDGVNQAKDSISIRIKSIPAPPSIITPEDKELTASDTIFWEIPDSIKDEISSYSFQLITENDTLNDSTTSTFFTIGSHGTFFDDKSTSFTFSIRSILVSNHTTNWSTPVSYSFISDPVSNYNLNRLAIPQKFNVVFHNTGVELQLPADNIFKTGKIMIVNVKGQLYTNIKLSGYAPGYHFLPYKNLLKNNGVYLFCLKTRVKMSFTKINYTR